MCSDNVGVMADQPLMEVVMSSGDQNKAEQGCNISVLYSLFFYYFPVTGHQEKYSSLVCTCTTEQLFDH